MYGLWKWGLDSRMSLETMEAGKYGPLEFWERGVAVQKNIPRFLYSYKVPIWCFLFFGAKDILHDLGMLQTTKDSFNAL